MQKYPQKEPFAQPTQVAQTALFGIGIDALF